MRRTYNDLKEIGPQGSLSLIPLWCVCLHIIKSQPNALDDDDELMSRTYFSSSYKAYIYIYIYSKNCKENLEFTYHGIGGGAKLRVMDVAIRNRSTLLLRMISSLLPVRYRFLYILFLPPDWTGRVNARLIGRTRRSSTKETRGGRHQEGPSLFRSGRVLNESRTLPLFFTDW